MEGPSGQPKLLQMLGCEVDFLQRRVAAVTVESISRQRGAMQRHTAALCQGHGPGKCSTSERGPPPPCARRSMPRSPIPRARHTAAGGCGLCASASAGAAPRLPLSVPSVYKYLLHREVMWGLTPTRKRPKARPPRTMHPRRRLKPAWGLPPTHLYLRVTSALPPAPKLIYETAGGTHGLSSAASP